MIRRRAIRSVSTVVFTICAGLLAAVGGISGPVVAQPLSPLPLPAATPVAQIKSIAIGNREVSKTDTTQATVTRGAQTVGISLPFFLYKGDAIETFADTSVTVLFLDDPVPARDNEVMLYPNAKISIGSSDSWWGRTWAKVKNTFTSRTRYSRLSVAGTEYELVVSQHEERAILTVIEGTVRVSEGPEIFSAARPSPQFDWEDVTSAPVKFVLAYFITPSPQTQFGRVVDVPAGQIITLPITYNVQSDCLQTHRFEFQTSEGTEWFRLVGDKNFQVQGPRGTASETRQIEIDATRLRPGTTHDVRVYATCLDCQQEAGCGRAQLSWVYRINVTRDPDAIATPSPTATPTPTPTPTPTAGPSTPQTFRVGEKQQSTISKGLDQVITAPDSDVRFVLDWTNAVLLTTQPTYSAQNLIPHFTNISERDASFVSARERAVFSKEAGAFAQLANVYSDWGQPAWASFAYDTAFDRATARQAGAITIDRAEAYRLSGRITEAEQKSMSFANDTSVRARNFFGNLALDRARIALDAGRNQDAEALSLDAKRQYATALVYGGAQTLPAAGQVNSALLGNDAEASIVAGESALERNAAPDAKARFAEAVRALESIQQPTSIYPHPVTDLGVAYRGQGDAAILSGDLKAATDAYANAKRQHEQAIGAHSDFAEAYFNLGDYYDNLGDPVKAKANYRLAIASRPEQPAAYYPLAMLLKDEDPALAAALAATFLKLEREPFLHGRRAENARKLAERRPVVRPPRIGERLGAVPGLVGRTQSEATSAITAAGFKVGRIQRRRMAGDPNVVREQTPPAGANAAAGSAIDLVISTGDGDVTLPNVVGKPQSQARAELEDIGLVVVAEIKPDTRQPKDHVSEQNPNYRPNKTVRAGSNVKLTVSAGDLVEIPNVIGKELDDARKKITSDNKLRVGSIDSRQDCKVDRVLEQSPPSSNQKSIERGTAINLVVGVLGDNPVTIPTFRERPSAELFVSENRLRLKRVREEESEAPAGTVLRQSPRPGRQFGRNCPVDVELTVAIPIVWVDIEDYSNQPIGVVQQKLRALEVNANVRYQQYSDAPEGTVIQQSPAGPTRVKHWSNIYLVVATKPQTQTVTVPNLCGMTYENARNLLASPKYGLVAQQAGPNEPLPTEMECKTDLENGQVNWQVPSAGAPVLRGTPVKIWLRYVILQ